MVFFLLNLKKGEVTCVFKANDQMINSNYRPITILPAVARVYERLMKEQMIPYSETFLSPYHRGFREGYNTEHALKGVLKNANQSWTKKNSQEQS